MLPIDEADVGQPCVALHALGRRAQRSDLEWIAARVHPQDHNAAAPAQEVVRLLASLRHPGGEGAAETAVALRVRSPCRVRPRGGSVHPMTRKPDWVNEDSVV